jgi:pSer/pThr/pTyr-binding forkhead associated (FHA) protein
VSDPIAAALELAFIVLLYLFLLWIARSALKDLRRPPSDRTDGAAAPSRPGLLVVERGGGLSAGAAFPLNGTVTIGRSPRADISIEDPFASGRHARVYARDGTFYVEDMGSTNGTYLNGARVAAEEALRPTDVIRIGDTELRYEER